MYQINRLNIEQNNGLMFASRPENSGGRIFFEVDYRRFLLQKKLAFVFIIFHKLEKQQFINLDL